MHVQVVVLVLLHVMLKIMYLLLVKKKSEKVVICTEIDGELMASDFTIENDDLKKDNITDLWGEKIDLEKWKIHLKILKLLFSL